VESWSESEEADPTAQWVSILKKGARARRRGVNDADDDQD